MDYVLNDEDYLSKYRCDLKSAVLRAKANPQALFKGYDVCIADHVQPPAKTLAAIVRSAGGNVSTSSSTEIWMWFEETIRCCVWKI